MIPRDAVKRFIDTNIVYTAVDPFAVVLDDGAPEIPIVVINTGERAVYLGFNDDAVTEITGVPLLPGKWLHINHNAYFGDTANDALPGTLYAVAPGGGQEVAVLRNFLDFSEDVFRGIVAARRGVRGTLDHGDESILLALGDAGMFRSGIDFTATRNAATVLDIADLEFEPEEEDFIGVWTAGDPDKPIITPSLTTFTWTPNVPGTSGELEVEGADFEIGETYVVLLRGPHRAYRGTVDNLAVAIENWFYELDETYVFFDENPSTKTDESEPWDVSGCRSLVMQYILDDGTAGVTITAEASIIDDGTPPASLTPVDVTTDLFGAANFTGADGSGIVIGILPANFKYLWIHKVSTADDGQCFVAVRKGVHRS